MSLVTNTFSRCFRKCNSNDKKEDERGEAMSVALQRYAVKHAGRERNKKITGRRVHTSHVPSQPQYENNNIIINKIIETNN